MAIWRVWPQIRGCSLESLLCKFWFGVRTWNHLLMVRFPVCACISLFYPYHFTTHEIFLQLDIHLWLPYLHFGFCRNYCPPLWDASLGHPNKCLCLTAYLKLGNSNTASKFVEIYPFISMKDNHKNILFLIYLTYIHKLNLLMIFFFATCRLCS